MAKKKKAAAPKKVTKSPKKAAPPKTKKRNPRGNSVDQLLKNFEKERKSQEAKLSSSLKKIEELELKSTKLQEQISSLKETAKTTQIEIDQLDSRRDTEVAEVLAKLGVQLSASQSPSEPLPKLTLGSSTPENEEPSDSDESSD